MNIVQIGSNRGYDDLTNYISENRNNINLLLLVEPLEKFNDSLNECYNYIQNKFIENIVVTDTNDEYVSIYLDLNMDDSQAQTSLLKEHVIKHFPNGEIIEKKVKCVNINNLFDNYNLSSIDYLFIDAEGIDDKIIKSIDFEKYSIDKIYYETAHINRKDIKNFLNENGYDVFDYEENSLAKKIVI